MNSRAEHPSSDESKTRIFNSPLPTMSPMTPKLVTEDVLIRIFCNQKLIVVIGDMVGNGELNILVLDSSELGCSAREFIEKLGFLSNQIFYGCAMSIVQ
jgi:hypothetical protein